MKGGCFSYLGKLKLIKNPEPGDAPDPYIDATTNLKALELAIIISKAYLLSNHSIYSRSLCLR